jgi:outer membrane protein assembly factor BamB
MLCCLATSICPAADWPSFRGASDMAGVAQAQVGEPVLRWRIEAGGPVESTAAIVAGTVFVATGKGDVIALDAVTGAERWRYHAQVWISASPCVLDGVVFVGDEAGTMHAVDAATGAARWTRQLGGEIKSSATPAGRTILVGTYSHELIRLDAATGEPAWTFTADDRVHGSPCVVGDQVAIAGCDGQVRFIGLADGKQRASVAVMKNDAVPTVLTNFAVAPAHRDGVIYVGSMDGQPLAVRVADGALLWKRALLPAGSEEGFYASAAVGAGAVVATTLGNAIMRLDPATGTMVWTHKAGGGIRSSPVIAGDRVVVGGDDGVLLVLDLADGMPVWHFAAGAAFHASPAIAGDLLVIGTMDGAVYGFTLGGKAKP